MKKIIYRIIITSIIILNFIGIKNVFGIEIFGQVFTYDPIETYTNTRDTDVIFEVEDCVDDEIIFSDLVYFEWDDKYRDSHLLGENIRTYLDIKCLKRFNEVFDCHMECLFEKMIVKVRLYRIGSDEGGYHILMRGIY